jgi:hypothetical protein
MLPKLGQNFNLDYPEDSLSNNINKEMMMMDIGQ